MEKIKAIRVSLHRWNLERKRRRELDLAGIPHRFTHITNWSDDIEREIFRLRNLGQFRVVQVVLNHIRRSEQEWSTYLLL